MKIAVWVLSDDACAEYRLKLPAEALMRQGENVIIDNQGSFVQWNIPLAEGQIPTENHHIVGISRYDADVVVMQRPANRAHTELIPFLQKQGIKVVIDVDDRYDKIHKKNQAFNDFDPQKNTYINYKFVHQACQIADLVTATTPALIEAYGFGKGVVIPNYISESLFNVKETKLPNSIGWSGAVVTHPEDLQTTGSAIANVCRDTGALFHVIGPPEGVQEALGTDQSFLATGWVPREDYFKFTSKIEVGIVPLTNSVFNQSKSGLKMMEYAAVGVPCVASPTPDNIRVNKLGIGLLASTPQKWQKILKSLITNEERRLELMERGFEAIQNQTYEKNAYKWLEAWKSVSS